MSRIVGSREQLHAYWQEVLDSGHFTEGKFVQMLENSVAEFYGMHAIAVNSAGSGLYTVLRGLDLGKNDVFAIACA